MLIPGQNCNGKFACQCKALTFLFSTGWMCMLMLNLVFLRCHKSAPWAALPWVVWYKSLCCYDWSVQSQVAWSSMKWQATSAFKNQTQACPSALTQRALFSSANAGSLFLPVPWLFNVAPIFEKTIIGRHITWASPCSIQDPLVYRTL